MPPALPSLFPFSPVLCSIWVPCRAAPRFAHSTEPRRASHGCSQLAAFMSELTNLPQGIKQKLGSPCSPCTPQRGCWTLPRGFLRAHGCMEQPSVILNHGSENPLWLSPSALQRDDKPASSVIAFFSVFSSPLHPPALWVLSGHPSTLCFPGTLPMLTANRIPQPHCGTAPGTKVNFPCRLHLGPPTKLAAETGFAQKSRKKRACWSHSDPKSYTLVPA